MLSPINNKAALASPGLIKFNAPSAVIDIETTGLSFEKGDRIVEIAVLVISGSKAGEVWQEYVNPERPVPKEASNIHGLKDDFLKNKPVFKSIASRFLSFIRSLGSNCQLVAHNGRGFDFPFINKELSKANYPPLKENDLIDSLDLARNIYPNQSNSLNSLCKRLNLDLTAREKYHGAVLDCRLLAQVYLKMIRSLETSLKLDTPEEKVTCSFTVTKRQHLKRLANSHELEKHKSFINTLNSTTLWDKNKDK